MPQSTPSRGSESRFALALLLLPLAAPGAAWGQARTQAVSPGSGFAPATQRVLIQAEIVEATPTQAQMASSASPGGDSRYPTRLANVGAECMTFPAWATAMDTTWGMQMSQGERLGLTPFLGTSLQVTPHVNPDHTLRLFISLVNKEPDSAGDGVTTTQEEHVMREATSGKAVMLVFGGTNLADGKWLFVFVTARLLPASAQAGANS